MSYRDCECVLTRVYACRQGGQFGDPVTQDRKQQLEFSPRLRASLSSVKAIRESDDYTKSALYVYPCECGGHDVTFAALSRSH